MELSFREIARNLSIATSTSTAFAAFRRFEETAEIGGKMQPVRESLRKLEALDIHCGAGFRKSKPVFAGNMPRCS